MKYFLNRLPPSSQRIITFAIETVILFCFVLISYWFLSATSTGINFVAAFINWFSEGPDARSVFTLPALNIKLIIFLAVSSPLFIWHWSNKQ